MNFIANESAQKLRGAYYTDSVMARYLTRWALGAGATSVLEPSCGDGAFLAAVVSQKSDALRRITACELVPAEAAKARARVGTLPKGTTAEVICTDFLAWAAEKMDAGERFDAVVGNPPFIRYQYLDAASQRRAETLFRRLGLPFTKHTNAWVPFVLASLAMLRPGGRLAMVVPAELLHILHAQSLRTQLLRSCSRVVVLDPEDIWFRETLQGVCLLLAERGEDDGRLANVSVVPVRGDVLGLAEPETLLADAVPVPGALLDRKWTLALLRPHERDLFDGVSDRPGFARFGDVSAAVVGIITGANKFFLVPDSVVHDYGLESFAHPMFGRSDHVPGVIYDRAQHDENRRVGLPTNFLWFREERPARLFPAAARRYIERGESEQLHVRFKCRVRTPWYRVPSVFAAPVGMLKRCNDFPRLVLNEVGAFTTDTAYRVTPRQGIGADSLVATFVNSLTALSAELEGRHYGGGVLELVPSEIARLWLPPLVGGKPELHALNQDITRRCLSADNVMARNDERILGGVLSGAERQILFEAWTRLRSRRQRIVDDEPREGDAEDQPISMAKVAPPPARFL